jgi:ribonuclease III
LAKRPKTDPAQLSERLGYAFTTKGLLKVALTHSSARTGNRPGEDNELLEFLGDRVLGLAVAELLIQRFPDAHEGELARWYNHLVRAETCATVATDWNLGPHMRMSGGEAESGGRSKKTILANACEALLGAVFMDRGYAEARNIVHRFWERFLSELEIVAPDAKSVLQEWAQGRKLSLPRYLEIAREGPDHAPRFTSEVHIEGIPPERGQGANKRAAEQAAAYRMLLREGVWTEPDNA